MKPRSTAETPGLSPQLGAPSSGARARPEECRTGVPLPRFDAAKRPSGRGYRLARCSGCRAPIDGCFCAELVKVDCKIRVLVILHALEQFRPTNTGRYATQVLGGSELRIRGGRSEQGVPLPLHLDDLDPADRGLLLLHPGPQAELLDDRFERPVGPVRLIVPDGTWTQTRQMLRREPRLKALRQVALPRGKPSIYALRRGVTPDGLCTLEAIARSLRALGDPRAAEELERILLIAVRTGMAARGYHDWQPPT